MCFPSKNIGICYCYRFEFFFFDIHRNSSIFHFLKFNRTERSISIRIQAELKIRASYYYYYLQPVFSKAVPFILFPLDASSSGLSQPAPQQGRCTHAAVQAEGSSAPPAVFPFFIALVSSSSLGDRRVIALVRWASSVTSHPLPVTTAVRNVLRVY